MHGRNSGLGTEASLRTGCSTDPEPPEDRRCVGARGVSFKSLHVSLPREGVDKCSLSDVFCLQGPFD